MYNDGYAPPRGGIPANFLQPHNEEQPVQKQEKPRDPPGHKLRLLAQKINQRVSVKKTEAEVNDAIEDVLSKFSLEDEE